MAKKKRKARKKTKGVSFTKPIDISKFGTEKDPCFGKLYNLSTDECKRCGDSELCGVIFSQKAHDKRKKIEKKKRFKDIELTEEENPSLTKWVQEKKDEGLTRSKVIKKAKRTFGSTRDEIKKIWKNLK